MVKVSFKKYLLSEQRMTREDLKRLETYASNLFNTLGIDVAFSNHFFDRLHDPRNGKDISLEELLRLFNLQYRQNGQKIKKLPVGAEAIMQDMKTDINMPVVFKYNSRTRMINLLAKTVLRKKNFYGADLRLQVEQAKTRKE